VKSQVVRESQLGMPAGHELDLGGLATFTLDPAGQVTSWSVTAARLFGHPATVTQGRHVCDVLLTGPGHRELVRDALAETAAGRLWAASVVGGQLGEGRFAIRWEPLAGLGGGAVVIAQRVVPQHRPSWLSDAAARIGTTLDLTQTAREIADVAVPRFADAAAIFGSERLLAADEFVSLQAEHGAVVVRRLAARLDGRSAAVTDSLLRPGEVFVFGPDSPSCQAMAAGAAVLYDQMDSADADRIGSRPGGPEITTSYASFLAVPLVARGMIVGCATFARAPGRPAFHQGDIALAGELASRAAVCIDNARLYRRERRTALALQRGLLPGQPDVPPGIEIAHCYLAVGASVVGGDWHDVVALPGGRAALIVGDAMGHGPEAAAVMVQLRTAAHTLAGLDLPPAQILHRLDQMATGMAAPFATCIYTVIDPAGSTCVAAQAGHLPPVIVLPDGSTQVLDLPPGLPLGLGTGSFEATPTSLPRGATVALYTDGLVESRRRTFDDGLAALREALSVVLARPGALEDACDAVTQRLRQHGEDDITLVLARIRK
jgi:GAF domain-containing protein